MKQNGRPFGHGSLASYSIPKVLHFLHERPGQFSMILFMMLSRAELGVFSFVNRFPLSIDWDGRKMVNNAQSSIIGMFLAFSKL